MIDKDQETENLMKMDCHEKVVRLECADQRCKSNEIVSMRYNIFNELRSHPNR
jgi:hypothetical protein